MKEASRDRLKSVVLDADSIGIGSPDQEHERQIAIYDLIEENNFGLPNLDAGPYALTLSMHDSKLVFDICDEAGAQRAVHILSLTPFRRTLRDYFMICESYYQAIRTQTATQIEAIDMGRRGIHDEGSRTLQERLKGKVRVDFETARRLFTLICVLHWKG